MRMFEVPMSLSCFLIELNCSDDMAGPSSGGPRWPPRTGAKTCEMV